MRKYIVSDEVIKELSKIVIELKGEEMITAFINKITQFPFENLWIDASIKPTPEENDNLLLRSEWGGFYIGYWNEQFEEFYDGHGYEVKSIAQWMKLPL